ncbi:MAG: hypothetical protein ACOCNA_03120, partial [Prevotella pectinovora]
LFFYFSILSLVMQAMQMAYFSTIPAPVASPLSAGTFHGEAPYCQQSYPQCCQWANSMET